MLSGFPAKTCCTTTGFTRFRFDRESKLMNKASFSSATTSSTPSQAARRAHWAKVNLGGSWGQFLPLSSSQMCCGRSPAGNCSLEPAGCPSRSSHPMLEAKILSWDDGQQLKLEETFPRFGAGGSSSRNWGNRYFFIHCTANFTCARMVYIKC